MVNTLFILFCRLIDGTKCGYWCRPAFASPPAPRCLPAGFHMPPGWPPYAARHQETVGFLFFCLFFSQIMINFTCRKTFPDLFPHGYGRLGKLPCRLSCPAGGVSARLFSKQTRNKDDKDKTTIDDPLVGLVCRTGCRPALTVRLHAESSEAVQTFLDAERYGIEG